MARSAFKMKGFGGFGNSPAKQVDLTKKKGKGPRAEVKKTDWEKMSYTQLKEKLSKIKENNS